MKPAINRTPAETNIASLKPASLFLDPPIELSPFESAAKVAFEKFCADSGYIAVRPTMAMSQQLIETWAPRRDLLEIKPVNPSPISQGLYEKLVLPPETTLDLMRRVADRGKQTSHHHGSTHPSDWYSQFSQVYRSEEGGHGHFSGFLQANIDVVGRSLASAEDQLTEEVDLIIAIYDALNAILEKIDRRSEHVHDSELLFRISHRKLFEGLAMNYGFTERNQVQRIINALDGIDTRKSLNRFVSELQTDLNQDSHGSPLIIPEEMCGKVWALRRIKGNSQEMNSQLIELGRRFQKPSESAMLAYKRATRDLVRLLAELEAISGECGIQVIGDASLARGCPIYSGIEFEGLWRKHPEIGSIAGGGRCDRIATEIASQKQANAVLRLAGGAIGITRIIKAIVDSKAPQIITTADVILTSRQRDTETRGYTFQILRSIAAEWKSRGIRVLQTHPRTRIGLGAEESLRGFIEYARSKRIPFIYFADRQELFDVAVGGWRHCRPHEFRIEPR